VVVNLTQDAAVTAAGDAAAALAPLSTLTGLTRLRMQDVSLLGQPQQRLEALAALTGLQHLDANGVQHVSGLEGARRLFDLALTSGPPLLPDGLLPRLHGLTYFAVDGMFYSPAVSVSGIQDVSCLKGLKHLSLNFSAVMQEVVAVPGGFPGFTELTQLTYLKLRQVSGTSLPSLAPLTALQRLDLFWCGSLPATVLTGLTSLQSVHLVFAGLEDAANATLFLSWLEQQAHMTTLVMQGMRFATPAFGLPDLPAELAAAAFAGLTAASKLQQLVLKDMLPRSAWQHIFPAGQLCTALTYLNIESRYGFESLEMLQRIAAACPNLQQARIDPRFTPGSTTAVSNLPSSALRPLTAVNTLVIQGVAEEHVPHLAQLTALRTLHLESPAITAAMATELAASLQHLTDLSITVRQLQGKPKALHLYSKVGGGTSFALQLFVGSFTLVYSEIKLCSSGLLLLG
jgi:hypothetical protein